jgi:hypothetical protein
MSPSSNNISAFAPLKANVDKPSFYDQLARAFTCSLIVKKNYRKIKSILSNKGNKKGELDYDVKNLNAQCIFSVDDQKVIFHRDFVEIVFPFSVDVTELKDAYYSATLLEDQYFKELWYSLKSIKINELHLGSSTIMNPEMSEKNGWRDFKRRLEVQENYFGLAI